MKVLRVPGLDQGEEALVNRLLGQLVSKQSRNFLRASLYDGKHALDKVSPIMPPEYYQLGIVLGWAGKAVDALARRCNLDGFVWADGDVGSLGLSEFEDGNLLFSSLKSAMISSLIHGPAFLINTTGGSGEPDSLLLMQDALNATGEWNRRTRGLDALLSVTRWGEDRRVEGFVLYRDGLTVTADKEDGKWEVNRISHSWGMPVEPLVYKPRLGREFGQSRMNRPMISLQERGIQTLIRLEGHMDVYSFPEFWMLGPGMEIFKNADGSTKPSWQIQLARLKGIPDDPDQDDPRLARADVKQFPAASPEPHLKALNAYAKLFAREASLPDADVAISDTANSTSADAYEQSREGLIAEAEGAMDDWSLGISRAVARGLAIQNGESGVPDEFWSIKPKVRDPRFLSRSAAADAGSKVVGSVPWLGETEVGLELLGLNQSQIDRANSERRQAELRAARRGLVESGPMRDTAAKDMQEEAKASRDQFEALGVAIRAGVDPVDAAQRVGLGGVKFTGAVPVSLRIPESKSRSLEDK